MLKKLFKYEWKEISKSLIILHGIVLLFAVLTRISFAVSGGLNENSTIAGLFFFLSIMVIGTAAIFTVVFIGYRFYKDVFTDQGYLTNTLPVTPQQIIISKGLTGILWMVLDIIVVIAAIFIIMADKETFSNLSQLMKEVIGYLFHGRSLLTGCLIVATIVLTPFVSVLKMYVSVSIGSLLSGHKLLGSVGVYAGIYVVEQIIMIITIAVTGNSFISSSLESENAWEMQVTGVQIANTTMIINLIISLIIFIAGFLVTKYIMTKKLNLQ